MSVQRSGTAGKRDGQTAVGHLGATTLRRFLSCHFLSIMIDAGNAEKGGAAVFMATRKSEHQNTEVLDATFCLWLSWGIVLNSHKLSLFQPVCVFF